MVAQRGWQTASPGSSGSSGGPGSSSQPTAGAQRLHDGVPVRTDLAPGGKAVYEYRSASSSFHVSINPLDLCEVRSAVVDPSGKNHAFSAKSYDVSGEPGEYRLQIEAVAPSGCKFDVQIV